MLLSDKLFGNSILKKMIYLLIILLALYCSVFNNYSYLIVFVGCCIIALKDNITFRKVCLCYLAFALGISFEYNITAITLVAMIFSIACMLYDNKNVKYYTLVSVLFMGFLIIDTLALSYKSNLSSELATKEKKFEIIHEHWTDKNFYMQALNKDDVSSFSVK